MFKNADGKTDTKMGPALYYQFMLSEEVHKTVEERIEPQSSSPKSVAIPAHVRVLTIYIPES